MMKFNMKNYKKCVLIILKAFNLFYGIIIKVYHHGNGIMNFIMLLYVKISMVWYNCWSIIFKIMMYNNVQYNLNKVNHIPHLNNY